MKYILTLAVLFGVTSAIKLSNGQSIQINDHWSELKNCTESSGDDNSTTSSPAVSTLKPLGGEIELKEDKSNAHVATCKPAPPKEKEGEKTEEKKEGKDGKKEEKP